MLVAYVVGQAVFLRRCSHDAQFLLAPCHCREKECYQALEVASVALLRVSNRSSRAPRLK